MKRGRQEDAHEFLRYSIDSLQKSATAILGPKPDPKIAETSWVHKLFGGKLRSRVTCKRCHHPSDTFDSCLDLSLDLTNAKTIDQALSNFVKPERLDGEDKYKCEK
jgi:ubiquitin carboxyl-terminal hydrolase 36/42